MSRAEAQRVAGRWDRARFTAPVLLPLCIFLLLIAVPFLARFGAESYVLTVFTRLMIVATAAVSLNLLIGYAGLVSFGHAAFIGLGAYSVGMLSAHGIHSLVAHVAVAAAACAVFALVTGAAALRTNGVNFIMITLAFGQMAFFLATSLAAYGGDDGLTIGRRSTVVGGDLLSDPHRFYYIVLGCLGVTWALCRMLVRSTFGRVLQGMRDNELRMEALGFSTFRYRLAAYVISGCIAGLSGILLANHTEFASPAYMSWQRSGELMAMVLVGGSAGVHAPIVGAGLFVLIEEILSPRIEHWKIIFGVLLVLAVVIPRRGSLPGT